MRSTSKINFGFAGTVLGGLKATICEEYAWILGTGRHNPR